MAKRKRVPVSRSFSGMNDWPGGRQSHPPVAPCDGMHITMARKLASSWSWKGDERLSQTSKETTMTTRILTIAAAAAIAVSAIGFTAPASATTLSAASQTIAQSVDSPIIAVSKKGGGMKGGGHKGGGKWHGHKGGKWHGHKGFYYYGNYGHFAPAYYGGCYKEVQALVGGYYVRQMINICF